MVAQPTEIASGGVYKARLTSDVAESSTPQAQQGLSPEHPEGPDASNPNSAPVPAGLQVLDAAMELLRQIDLDTADTSVSPSQPPALPQSGSAKRQSSAVEDLDNGETGVRPPHQQAVPQSGSARSQPNAVGDDAASMTDEKGLVPAAPHQAQYSSAHQHTGTRVEYEQLPAQQQHEADNPQQSDDSCQQALSHAHAAEAAQGIDSEQPDEAHTPHRVQAGPAMGASEVQVTTSRDASLEQGGECWGLGEQASYGLASESSAGQFCCGPLQPHVWIRSQTEAANNTWLS